MKRRHPRAWLPLLFWACLALFGWVIRPAWAQRADVPKTLAAAVAVPEPAAAAAPAPTTEKKEPEVKPEAPRTSIPLDAGLPVNVSVGVFIVELRGFDDVKGEFEATSDLRLTWTDARLGFEVSGITQRYKEWRDEDAEAQLAGIWRPNVDIDNRIETTGYTGHRLRIYGDGTVESITRATSRFRVDVDVERFPFDEQRLVQEVVMRRESTDDVVLRFDQADEKFSKASAAVKLWGWSIGDVDLDATDIGGWNGERYSAVNASLAVTRVPSTGLTTIFIPLVASLLIPLLALWMNRPTEDGFEIPAFELANMGIGGLFSVIALSFAVSSAYGTIAGSDNTVTRLFALNYATLAVSLGIMVLLFRFNLVLRWFGPFVQDQVFRFLLWALPLLTLSTSVAFMLIAAA